jgi:hypothetical protein
MHVRKFIPAATVLAGCLFGSALAGSWARAVEPTGQLALQQLQADFHGASALGDYDLMYSLWADDAVVSAGGGMFHGPDEIADFFSSSPNWGQAAALAPTYKTVYDIHGNTATLQFECVIVNTGGLDPLTTPLSTIPFGGQNPAVAIVQHSTATCTAVRQGNGWVFQTFVGSAGPPS